MYTVYCSNCFRWHKEWTSTTVIENWGWGNIQFQPLAHSTQVWVISFHTYLRCGQNMSNNRTPTLSSEFWFLLCSIPTYKLDMVASAIHKERAFSRLAFGKEMLHFLDFQSFLLHTQWQTYLKENSTSRGQRRVSHELWPWRRGKYTQSFWWKWKWQIKYSIVLLKSVCVFVWFRSVVHQFSLSLMSFWLVLWQQ